MEETPVVQDAVVVDKPGEAVKAPESPAKDLREIQALIVNSIFQGNMAPAVTKAYQLLEAMAVEIEKKAMADAK